MHKYTFEKVESFLESLPEIKFAEIETIDHQSVEDFLIKFFEINEHHSTEDDDGDIICLSGKRRSIGDIYRIAKYYDKNIKLSDIYKSLINLVEKDYLYSFICQDLHRRVWRRVNNNSRIPITGLNNIPTDEFGFDYSEVKRSSLYASMNENSLITIEI